MRASRGAVAVGLVMPVLFACSSPPHADDEPFVTAFTESTDAGQALRAAPGKARADLDECRSARQQGVYPRERNFPCEAFLGE